MKKLAILFLIFIKCLNLTAQVIQKSDLEKFNWFADNHDKRFYKSDTISLIAISDPPQSYISELNRKYRELEYNDTNNITKIKFKKKNNLDVYDLDAKTWTTTRIVGTWKWKFDLQKQLISFYLKEKFHSSFIVKEKSTKTLVWKYDFYNKPTEETYHLLILTLVRIK